jgi:biopolymer transport protein ExbB/TolQ
MNGSIIQATHTLVPLLLQPVVIALFVCLALACADIGVLLGERWQLRRRDRPTDLAPVERRAHRRIERADILTRTAPMLGLMATLISLGPGLTALSNGSLGQLAAAMLTAFDTTVLGLAAGIVGFIIGRLRRRWYDEALTRWERDATGASS